MAASSREIQGLVVDGVFVSGSSSSNLVEVLSLDRLRTRELLLATPESAVANPLLRDLFTSVEAYAVEVEPRSCSAAIKALGDLLPLRQPPGAGGASEGSSSVCGDGGGAMEAMMSLTAGSVTAPVTPLNHLKRVRRTQVRKCEEPRSDGVFVA